MAAGEQEFEQRDRMAASNVAEVAKKSGVKRIIYLGGLGRRDVQQSAHLKSRHEVGDLLRGGGIPVTEFRAAVIVGSGSASFEMMHHLVNRLPVMICPRWVMVRTQPIAISDVLSYLVEAVEKAETVGRNIDIGGPEVLTYRAMMLTVAKVLGLKRLLIQVPVLTPRLSSYWVNLVTPIPTPLARALIESLRSETVCENTLASELFSIVPMGFEAAVRRALEGVTNATVESTWTQADSARLYQPIDPSHLLSDQQVVQSKASPEELFRVVSSIGGERGWYYADWLWKVRGFIDKQIGGVGLRRGRRHQTEIRQGEALDFWRVEEVVPGVRLVLRAEMEVWGQAWLEFVVEKTQNGGSQLIQTARYYPKGVFGLVYWYSIYPIHAAVFRGMARAIVRRAANGG
jgi:uncharacterized protein YbjT (DUF2867 family)/uncharacterized protein YndB with AHSA1/START domain